MLHSIPGYRGLYAVTRGGRVWSLRTHRWLRPRTHAGYARVALFRDGARREHSVHRLVLLTFVGRGPRRSCCNHRNGNKHDNRLCNLEWVTYSENLRHSYRRGLHGYINSNKNGRLSGAGNGRAKLTDAQVRAIRAAAPYRRRGDRTWARYGISKRMYYNVVNDRNWSHVQ